MQQSASPSGSADVLPGQVGRARVAHQDVSLRGAALDPLQGGRGWAGDDQLPVGSAHQEEVEPVGVDTDGHAQLDPSGLGLEHADLPQSPAHVEGGRRRPMRMVVPAKEQQQGVAAELQQGAVMAVGIGQQPVEALGDDVGDSLGSGSAEPGHAFGERGEAGDVDEHHRPVDPPVKIVGSPRLEPFANQTGYIARQRVAPAHVHSLTDPRDTEGTVIRPGFRGCPPSLKLRRQLPLEIVVGRMPVLDRTFRLASLRSVSIGDFLAR